MMTSWLVTLALVCGQATESSPPKSQSSERSSETKPADLKATVLRLVKQLDDSQLARREAAEKELIALGAEALTLLPAVTKQTPAEVKDRLARVRRALESAAAESVTKPQLVTLQGEMKLSAALESLAQQSGNQLLDWRDRFGQRVVDKTVKLDIQKQSFWYALDSLLDQADLTTYLFTGQRGAIGIVARSEMERERFKRGIYSGMFRFEPTTIEAVRDLRNPQSDALRLTIDVSWEPRLNPIVMTQELDSISVVDEQGRALSIDGQGGAIELEGDGETPGAEVVIPLRLPGRSVEKIGSLKGRFDVLAAGKYESFEFTDLEKAKNLEVKKAAVTVYLDQVRRNQDAQEIRMRVKFDSASNALESHRGWIYGNPAYLIDPQGQIVDPSGSEATLQENDQVGISYLFALEEGLKGYKFVYRTPVSLIKIPVEYELKGIELP
ncbi:MAG: hypothetical protein ACKOU6_18500 [Planctomycetota bacterium]